MAWRGIPARSRLQFIAKAHDSATKKARDEQSRRAFFIDYEGYGRARRKRHAPDSGTPLLRVESVPCIRTV
jgi:hypothetical protein